MPRSGGSFFGGIAVETGGAVPMIAWGDGHCGISAGMTINSCLAYNTGALALPLGELARRKA